MPTTVNFLQLTNLLKMNRFLSPRSVNIFSPFIKMGKNVEKKVEKVENRFPSGPLSQESRNLILFFQIHHSKNEIIHKKSLSTSVCLLYILHEARSEDQALRRLSNKSFIEASFFNLIQKSLITDI
jgi:hypothetical protein